MPLAQQMSSQCSEEYFLPPLLDLPVHCGCAKLHGAHDLGDLVRDLNHHFGFAAIDCHVNHTVGISVTQPALVGENVWGSP